jgi:hypothetical protein
MLAFSPHQSTFLGGAIERYRVDPVDIVRSRRTRKLSGVSVIGDRDESQEPRRGQLLAVHELRRTVERVTDADRSGECISMAMIPTATIIRELLELIAALDRRVPQVQRAGEVSIARDAAALKARALQRIEELEREQPS